MPRFAAIAGFATSGFVFAATRTLRCSRKRSRLRLKCRFLDGVRGPAGIAGALRNVQGRRPAQQRIRAPPRAQGRVRESPGPPWARCAPTGPLGLAPSGTESNCVEGPLRPAVVRNGEDRQVTLAGPAKNRRFDVECSPGACNNLQS